MASEFYDVEGFLRGAGTLRPFEVAELGPVRGKRLIHLQCHFGLDTLSWARRGAAVTGLDFSPAAIEAAAELAERAGLEARFVAGDIHDAPALLGGERFDVVYTGLGALNWLADTKRWAAVVAQLLEPRGVLYLSEFHPMTWTLADETLEIVRDYFHDAAGERFSDEGTYADSEARTVHNETREWNHPLADVIGALLGAGLELELLSEHDYTLFARWPFLVEDTRTLEAGSVFRLPEGMPRLPLMYSLRARAPGP